MKGVMRFGQKGKLAPRYIEPIEIHSRVGDVAYKLVLQSDLSPIYQVFHIFMLRKYISDPLHVLQPQTVELNEDLTYEDYLMAIVDRQVHQLHTEEIPMVKVLWSNHAVENCTWETEVDIQS